ncbi:MAG: response regulator [Elusimicrobia bacterium]|nr:response regulator [Elusimicrobiota bacterium]
MTGSADEAAKGVVMVVDDDPLIVKLLSVRIEEMGYRIVAFEDVNEAIRQAQSVGPAVILSDIQLSMASSGADFLAALRKIPALRDTGVIFVTGTPIDKVRKDYPAILKDSRVRLFGKPVDWPSLREAISELAGE